MRVGIGRWRATLSFRGQSDAGGLLEATREIPAQDHPAQRPAADTEHARRVIPVAAHRAKHPEHVVAIDLVERAKRAGTGGLARSGGRRGRARRPHVGRKMLGPDHILLGVETVDFLIPAATRRLTVCLAMSNPGLRERSRVTQVFTVPSGDRIAAAFAVELAAASDAVVTREDGKACQSIP